MCPTTPDPSDHERYLDREASELEYHARVLQMATRLELPVLERLRFLAIFTTLTDEFFRVRVAGLKEQEAAGVAELSRAGHTPSEQIDHLRTRFRELVAEQRRLLEEQLLPSLAVEGIRFVAWNDLTASRRDDLSARFEEEVLPVLTPLAVGPAHPFPFISDLSLSLGVVLQRPGDAGESFARVKVPALLGRFVSVEHDGEMQLLPLEEVIGAHLDRLFPDVRIVDWHTFRVTRNADYEMEDIDVEDLLDAVAEEILGRRFGRVVRLEAEPGLPDSILDTLVTEMGIAREDVYRVPAPLDLTAMWDLADLDRPDLKLPSWDPVPVAEFADTGEDLGALFRRLRGKDVLVHHPYESFTGSVETLIRAAAADPRVIAMKQTLYRTSGDSRIMQSIIRAAERGKQAVVLVELKARFDEEANIAWARRLEEVGAHVVYGFVGLKTHTKTALIVRRDEDGKVRRYGHIATGNYNAKTATSYEDLGLFTSDEDLTADLGELFNQLTGQTTRDNYRKLLVAPVSLKRRLVELIGEQAHPGGRIVVKINNLSHNQVIDALYDASQQGAEIDLIIRSICCLRPGVPGLSENIRVRSVVGRWLEHSRIFRFGHGPDDGTYLIGSADLMGRNLDHRVEAVTPVEDPGLRARLDELLDLYLRDDHYAWTLDGEGAWCRVRAEGDGTNVQQTLMEWADSRRR